MDTAEGIPIANSASSKKEKKKGKKTSEARPTEADSKDSKFDTFIIQHKKTWIWFNFIAIVISIGCAVGTFLVLDYSTESCPFGSLKLALWLVFAMHLVNIFEFFFNLTGLERKICDGTMMCVFFIFEFTVLIYMQVIYFESNQCYKFTPLMYFWLMGQILLFYVVVVLTVCFFFRKFCGDPKNEIDSDNEDIESVHSPLTKSS